ncbi:ferric reductase-like transmembrane domain-containing protein [uncultured Arsenicicoccus sp.]|mgnify:CR=1 FL=1|uniref:ferric reductase-like transmembrane domain-containing protein n=1 Tax=uncultured Arsenicicoccus sp. TaxID=491339 RepID=UPI002596559F|nr:ferric reductase-like transmembrane domain-containing protein [uncultured Arsenicicoccus sp.]
MNEALWVLGRATGVSTLVMLTVATALGVVMSGGFRHRELPRFALAEIHRRASLLATGLLVVHVLSLWLDAEAQLDAVDLLVPFLNARNPLWWGLGTLALDLLLIVVVSSLLRKRLPHAVWRGLHLLAYASWPFAVLHSVGGGTDSATWWVRLTAITCCAVVGGAVGYRLVRRSGSRLVHRSGSRLGRTLPPTGRPVSAKSAPAANPAPAAATTTATTTATVQEYPS